MKKFYTLYIARNEAGDSTADAAKLLGITKANYWNRENGVTDFKLKEAFKLAEHYGVPVDELFKEAPQIRREVG